MAIVAGLTKSCAKSCSGGVARAWVANVQDIASFTFDSDDQITAITMVATKVFYEMQFKRGTKGLIETPTVGDDGCIASVQQIFQGSAQCRDQDSRNWLISAIKQSCCGLVLAIEEENGFVSISGFLPEKNYRIGGTTEINSGAALTDGSQMQVGFVCDTVVDGLATNFTGGAAGIIALT
jgi:hypothetical protein